MLAAFHGGSLGNVVLSSLILYGETVVMEKGILSSSRTPKNFSFINYFEVKCYDFDAQLNEINLCFSIFEVYYCSFHELIL